MYWNENRHRFHKIVIRYETGSGKRLYHSACEGRVQSDGGADWTDGHARAYGGRGDRAGGSQSWRGGHQGLLAAEQRLAQGREAFLRGSNMSRG